MTNCVNCGQLIPKEQKICPYCGAAQEERTVLINEMNTQQPNYGGQNMQQGYGQPQSYEPQPGYNQQQSYEQPQQRQGARKPVNGKKIGIIAGIAVALVLVIVLVVKLTGPGALSKKAALKSYLEALVDKDVDDFLDARYPKKVQKGLKKKYSDYEDQVEQGLSQYYYMEDVRNIRVAEIEKLDKSVAKDIEDQIKDECNVNVKISECVVYECRYEVKIKGEWEEIGRSHAMYKVGGKWFVVN